MTEQERIIKKQELKEFLISMPIKAVIAAIIPIAMHNSGTDMGFWDSLLLFVMLYSALSLYIFISHRVGNWIFGGIVLIVGGLIISTIGLPETLMAVFAIVLFFGGFALDVWRIIQYVRFSAKPETAAAAAAGIAATGNAAVSMIKGSDETAKTAELATEPVSEQNN